MIHSIIWWEPPLWLIAVAYGALAALCYVSLPQFIVGLIAGQLLEYVKHRWFMHVLFAPYHRVHHIDVRKYPVLPLVVPPTAIALLYPVFPVGCLSGTVAGYVIYEVMHRISPPWHNDHHKNPKRAFGVTTPIIDWILGTR